MPWSGEDRRLGVAVGRIVITGATGPVGMPVDHPSLRDGWWAVERDEWKLWRWTDGSALLPLPPGAAILEIHLAGATPYLLEAEVGEPVVPGRSIAA